MKKEVLKKRMILLLAVVAAAALLCTGCGKKTVAAPAATETPAPTAEPTAEPMVVEFVAQATAEPEAPAATLPPAPEEEPTPVPEEVETPGSDEDDVDEAEEETAEVQALANEPAGKTVEVTVENEPVTVEVADPGEAKLVTVTEPSPLPTPDDEEMKLLHKFFRTLIESRDADTPEALEKVREKNPARAAELDYLLDYWKKAEQEGFVNYGILPDGLPEDNSLCIIVMGYKLSQSGGMKAELKGRCEVALASAKKYPNAYILCTGGPTSSGKEDVTEAGKMASWFKNNGIAKSRILVEDDSKSTNENIKYCYTELTKHPEIKCVAIVSSDYHIIRSSLLFTARFLMKGSSLRVVSNAAYDTNAKSVIEQRKSVADGVRRLYGVS